MISFRWECRDKLLEKDRHPHRNLQHISTMSYDKLPTYHDNEKKKTRSPGRLVTLVLLTISVMFGIRHLSSSFSFRTVLGPFRCHHGAAGGGLPTHYTLNSGAQIPDERSILRCAAIRDIELHNKFSDRHINFRLECYSSPLYWLVFVGEPAAFSVPFL